MLVVVAHPDDEVLGCGASLAKHLAEGDDVAIHYLVRRGLEKEILAAGLVLNPAGVRPNSGTARLTVQGTSFEDQKLDAAPFLDVIQEIEQWKFNPDIIYTHYPHDLNLDHSITARAVLTAFRPKPDTKPCTILAFETLSATEWNFGYQPFQPNWFVPITATHLATKTKAMRAYPSELRKWPHPRSVEGIYTLAKLRGQQCGRIYAEAFLLLRRTC